MRKQDSWSSEYRKKKFYENRRKMDYSCVEEMMSPSRIPSTMPIMLDLDGTVDGITDEKVQIFMKQLEILRRKFKADKVIIVISTHGSSYKPIKEVLDIIFRNKTKYVEIGKSFYYGGSYNYVMDEVTLEHSRFNVDKIKTFDDYYVDRWFVDNKWIGIIDDGAVDNAYKNYQDKCPVLLCRPSQRTNNFHNHIMRIDTDIYGFDGVLASLDSYIDMIDKMTQQQILDKQSEIIGQLSAYDLVLKIQEYNFSFIEKYFNQGFADEEDYNIVVDWLYIMNSERIPSSSELNYLMSICQMLLKNENIQNNEVRLEKIKRLQLLGN